MQSDRGRVEGGGGGQTPQQLVQVEAGEEEELSSHRLLQLQTLVSFVGLFMKEGEMRREGRRF